MGIGILINNLYNISNTKQLIVRGEDNWYKFCNVITNDNFKIFSDNRGHITFKGAEYIKEKIKNKGFLNLLN